MEIELLGNGPAYLDIVRYVTEGLRQGSMKPGDRLPTERELADKLGLARGTVNKAYNLLKRDGLVLAVQGAGSFIAGPAGIMPEHEKRHAVNRLDDAIRDLLDRGFGLEEIETLFSLRIESVRSAGALLRLAAVDCNPEALAIFREQLAFLANVDIHLFQLDDLRSGSLPLSVLSPYPLVLTTLTHERELAELLSDNHHRIVRVSVSPSQETVIAIASLQGRTKLGIITRSVQFRRIILDRLIAMGMQTESIPCALEDDHAGVLRVLSQSEVVLLPPDGIPGSSHDDGNQNWHRSEKTAFAARGGLMIPFMYCLERGSLIHVEERIASLLPAFQRKEDTTWR